MAMECYRKITEYMDSPYFSAKLEKYPRPNPPPQSSYQTLLSSYNTIKAVLMKDLRSSIVDQMFAHGLKFAEFSLVQLGRQNHFMGLSQEMMKHKNELFQPELEEISIEMSNNWIPSPLHRLVFKLSNILMDTHAAFKMAQMHQGNPKHYPQQSQSEADQYYSDEDGDDDNDPNQGYEGGGSKFPLGDSQPGNQHSVSFAEPAPSTTTISQEGSGQQNNIFQGLRPSSSSEQVLPRKRQFTRSRAPSTIEKEAGEALERGDTLNLPAGLGSFDHA